eukprot:COSAG02_NODE_4733_length_5040_cov_3.321392_6_plen_54_part_00
MEIERENRLLLEKMSMIVSAQLTTSMGAVARTLTATRAPAPVRWRVADRRWLH